MVYLEENQYSRLSQIAKKEKKSLAQIIRQAVDDLLKRKGSKVDYMSVIGIGKGAPGRVSEEAEEYLKELFQKSQERKGKK